MRRYDALKAVAPGVGDALVVTNLANTATEWRTLRPHDGNLYFVGMGMVTPYALGLGARPAAPARSRLRRRWWDPVRDERFSARSPSRRRTISASSCSTTKAMSRPESGNRSPRCPPARSTSRGVARASGLANVFEVRTVEEFEAQVTAGLAREDGPTVIVAKTSAEQAFVGTFTLRRQGEQVQLRPPYRGARREGDPQTLGPGARRAAQARSRIQPGRRGRSVRRGPVRRAAREFRRFRDRLALQRLRAHPSALHGRPVHALRRRCQRGHRDRDLRGRLARREDTRRRGREFRRLRRDLPAHARPLYVRHPDAPDDRVPGATPARPSSSAIPAT